jgi:hypothetical protein
VHTGLESNSEFYDEDVNVYLAQLLNSHIDPKYLARSAQKIARDDADLFRMIESNSDDRFRYETYRANADYLLMGLSIFDLFDGHRYNRLSVFRTPREVYVGRAGAYYSLAASYATKLRGGPSGVSRTLQKLADGITNYVRIMSYMRGHYLDLIRRYSPGELFHLDLTIKEVERGEALERRRDEFLDTYHAWLKTGMDELREKLVEQARLLREIDPTFEFTPPS